ncbi:Protein CBG26619 [Caenorhabditis briggsae]|uniref:Protein CBG26619 n=1 Tax=Caenorhabditis briggsae TaxID=6238 RepID=B6IL99_CAEBR|nr:Protein CBG26619 [Caenorhabditis briggsae]CAS00679.1 Protein CBG26619 [Caenorhabditis briggsae]
MSKRPAPECMTSQIIDNSVRMAVTFQMKEFTDKAALYKRPVRQMRCKFCYQEHDTADCSTIPQDEKIATAIQERLCLTCLTRAFHIPVNCGRLKQNHLLCQNKTCGKNREYHHASICNKTETTNSGTGSKIPLVDINLYSLYSLKRRRCSKRVRKLRSEKKHFSVGVVFFSGF